MTDAMQPKGQQRSIITYIGSPNGTPEKAYEQLKKLRNSNKIYKKIHAAFDQYKDLYKDTAKKSSDPVSFNATQAVVDLENILGCEDKASTSSRDNTEILTVRLFMEAIYDRKRYEKDDDENDETLEFETSSIVTRALCSIRPKMPFDTANDSRATEFPGDTPFEAAASTGATEIVKIMIDSLNKELSNTNTQDLRNYVLKPRRRDNKTAFFLAAKNLQLGVLRLFLEEYKYPDLADMESLMSTIQQPTEDQQDKAVDNQALQAFQLISKKMTIEDDKYVNIWQQAVERSSLELVRYLLDAFRSKFVTYECAKIVITQGNILMWKQYQTNQDEAALYKLLREGDRDLLHVAVRFGKVEIVEAILDKFPNQIQVAKKLKDENGSEHFEYAIENLRKKTDDPKSQIGTPMYTRMRNVLLHAMIRSKSKDLGIKEIRSILRRSEVEAYTICLHLSTVNIEDQSFSEYVQWLQAQTAKAGNIFRFESILKYANFPDLHAQPPKNTEDIIRSLQIDHEEISVVFRWLRDRGVKQILELSVPDRLLCPHSDDQVAYCVNGLRIRVLNWRKLDLYLGNLSDKQGLEELHLYSSGNTAVYKGWLKELRDFPDLKKLRVYVVKDVLSPNRAQTVRDELQRSFNDLNKDLGYRWVKPSDKGSSVLPNVWVKEYSWVKGQTNHAYRNLAEITNDVVGPNLASFINNYRLAIKGNTDSRRTKVALIDSGVVVVGGKRAMRSGDSQSSMENELKLRENNEQQGQQLMSIGDKKSQPINSEFEEDEKWWNQDLARQVRDGESFVNTGDDEEQVWWHASEPHGTQMARLICSVDPCCELYVAKIAETRSSGVSANVLAEAIQWAISKNVDVISLSLVAYSNTDLLNKAFIDANKQDIIVLCSTADEGFLPRDAVKTGDHQREVITITACDKWGNLLDRSQPADYDYRFMGNNVQIGQVPFLKSHEFITGSSVATAIAAGTASLIIACSRLSDNCNTHEDPDKTKWRSKMVRKTFDIMKRESGKDYVVLENLCGTRKNLQETNFTATVNDSFKSVSS